MMKFSNIQAKNIQVGVGTFIDESATIRGLNGEAEHVRIGDHSYIGANVQIICDDFELGDYCKIHHDTNIHGYNPCHIGHNAWIGQFCIIDSIGGVQIGNNCGVGAGSQLWSHIKFGDKLEGNRFNSDQKLVVGNDVWFVGHCIVSPIIAADKSMAMVGSVVTRNMEQNRVYAGVPAKDITEKVGPQFEETSLEQKLKLMEKYLNDFGGDVDEIKIVADVPLFPTDNVSYFAVATREYTKTNSEMEVEFMKFLLPEKAKFVPAVSS